MHFRKSITPNFRKGIVARRVLNLVILSLLFALYNCKIDEDTINHSSRLKLYTASTNTYNIRYDIQGKPIVIGNNAINYNSNSKITIIDPYYYFTYNEHNNINTISAISNATYSLEDASILYNNQQLILSESINYIQTSSPNTLANISRTFTYNSSQLLIEILEEKSEKDKINTFKKQFISYDNNGNIVKIETLISLDNGKTYLNKSIVSYTYDNNKNPFYNLLLDAGISNNYTKLQYFGIPTLSLGTSNLKLQYYNPHNLLSSEKVTSNGDKKTIHYSYKYNSDNLPIDLIKTTTNSKTGISRQYYSWFYEK